MIWWIITKKYKKNLIKYLPLTPLDISLEKPYISIFSIFNYFSMLLNTKIISPSLIIYEIANKIKNFYRKSTIEFFSENDYEVSGEIKQDELINFFYKKLKIGEKEIMIFYDMVNYNKKNKVKIEDIILTIDSFRDDNNNDIFNEKDKNLLFLKIIFDKVFINIDKIFKKENKEYLNYSDLKDKIMKEISKNKKYLNYEEKISLSYEASSKPIFLLGHANLNHLISFKNKKMITAKNCMSFRYREKACTILYYK